MKKISTKPSSENAEDGLFSTDLNPAQQRAVAHSKGPLLVIAGAGSGKTRVITTRIVHLLINEYVSPSAIIALTFTNKAANEMRERIHQILGTREGTPFIGTFHAYCLQLLKANRPPASPAFSILDANDQHKLISSILARMHKTKKPSVRQLAHQISQIKNGMADMHPTDPLFRHVYQAYEQEKKVSNCFDFDDLLLEALALFKQRAFKEMFHKNIRHILVDEYQDTNVVQHELLKNMALDKKKFIIDSLCAVGDEDQSIYSWRGATVANMLNFTKDFPRTVVVTIDQNYRSVQPILAIANNIIQNNIKRNPKQLWSTKQGSDRVRILTCLSGYQEADVIARLLQTIKRIQPLRTVAILYRAHYQSRALEEALIKHSLPYVIIGGIQFYERAEIKDVLAYLRLIVNPFDRISFFRVVNTPARGLGEKFEELCYERWNKEPFLSYEQLCHALITEKALTTTKKKALKDFLTVADGLTHTSSTAKALEQIVKNTDYLTYLRDTYDAEDARARSENIKELMLAVAHFEERGLKTITDVLDEVALMQEAMHKSDEEHDRTQLMTLHAAKGLEFDTVIITGLEEGILPSGHTLSDDGLEEERRLLYVGITRARERLILTNARFRATYGTMEYQQSSRFIDEIPHDHSIMSDCSSWQATTIETYFNEWLQLKLHIQAPSLAQEKPLNSRLSLPEKSLQQEKPEHRAKRVRQELQASSITPTRPTLNLQKFKKNQPVIHAKFGVGIIEQVEQKSAETLYVRVRFKQGTKKLDAKFVSPC